MDTRIAALAVAALSSAAMAQEAGDDIVMAGWVSVHGVRTRAAIHTDLRPSVAGGLLVPESFDSQGASASISKVDTLGITSSHYLTDHWSVDFAGGIPAKVDVYGQGSVSPGGPAGPLFTVDIGDPEVNPLGSARQWSPALMASYHFRIWRLSPFLSLGGSFTWFTEARLNPAFEQRLNNGVGRQMALAAGKPGPTYVTIDPHTTFAPVFGGGVPWLLSDHWLVVGSLAYAPFQTRTQVEVHASDGTVLSTSVARIGVDAVISGLLLGYRW